MLFLELEVIISFFRILNTNFFNLEIIGCVLFGWLSDRLGRKKTYFAAALTLLVGGILNTIAPTWFFVALSRVIVGSGGIGMNNVGFVYANELFPTKQRTLFGIIHELSWGL